MLDPFLDSIDNKQEDLDGVSGCTTAGLHATGTGTGVAGVFEASGEVVKGFAAAAGGILGIIDHAQRD